MAGKEKNIVYSHLHPTVKTYDPRPKPVGLAFGGSLGNERIFLDEDFAGVTIRHHAGDKTYQHGSLFPGQVSNTILRWISVQIVFSPENIDTLWKN